MLVFKVLLDGSFETGCSRCVTRGLLDGGFETGCRALC